MFAAPPKSSQWGFLPGSATITNDSFPSHGTGNASARVRFWTNRKEERMFVVHKEKIGDVSVILCKGKMVGGDAAFKLGEEVKRQKNARVVLLDLSELVSLGGEVMMMLVVLQVWTRGLGIQFKLFDPPPGLRQSLRRLRPTVEFEIASIDDVLSLLHWTGTRNRVIESASEASGLRAA
jgi:anti-anti-sigma regulatory factor